MDKMIDRIFYFVFYGIFFLIGKALRFTFDVLVYLFNAWLSQVQERRLT